MTPINTSQCNVMLNREGGTIKQLPAKLNPKDGVVETYWEPTVEERAALSYGANVRLSVIGPQMPPVSMDVSYIGQNGPVVFYKDTLDKIKMGEKLDEAEEFARKAQATSEESLRLIGYYREITECPKGGDLARHLGRIKEAQAILLMIRKVSECPDGVSLITHIEGLVEDLAAYRAAEEDNDDAEELEDDDDDDDDDWWKKKQAGEEE